MARKQCSTFKRKGFSRQTDKLIAEAFGKLAIDTIDNKKVLNERLCQLNYDELRALMVAHSCELSELSDRVWAHIQGKSR
jgi:hypothetical protein